MKLQSIQALRGVAALLVVLFHARALELKGIAANGLTEQPLIGGLFTNGFAGVDLFFVISGFIMVFVTRDGLTGLKPAASFLFARVTRIYPVWWAFAGCMTIYMLVAHGVSGNSEGWQKAAFGHPMLPYLVKSFLLIPQEPFPVLNVGWTLIHEIYFYLVFALFLLMPRRWLPILLAIWAVIVTGGALLGFSRPTAMTWLSLAVHPITLEFLLGAAAGFAVTKGLVWRSGILTQVATLWLLAALCYEGSENGILLEWGRVIWFGLPCALLVYGCAGLDMTKRHAWLIPAMTSALVTLALYQLTGVDRSSPEDARRNATILTVAVGAIAIAIVVWFGWLLGQGAPDKLRQARSFFQPMLDGAVRVGDWSFALYLCHLIVLSALRNVFALIGQSESLAPFFRLGHPGALDNITFAVAGIVLTLTASALSYRFYEQPLTILFGHLRKVWFRRGQPQTAPA